MTSKRRLGYFRVQLERIVGDADAGRAMDAGAGVRASVGVRVGVAVGGGMEGLGDRTIEDAVVVGRVQRVAVGSTKRELAGRTREALAGAGREEHSEGRVADRQIGFQYVVPLYRIGECRSGTAYRYSALLNVMLTSYMSLSHRSFGYISTDTRRLCNP